MDDAQRASELAEIESYDVLWNALYSALEADLSGLNWPKNSDILLTAVAPKMEHLIELAEGGNNAVHKNL